MKNAYIYITNSCAIISYNTYHIIHQSKSKYSFVFICIEFKTTNWFLYNNERNKHNKVSENQNYEIKKIYT